MILDQIELEEIKAIKAIDVHSHFGDWNLTSGLKDAQKYMPGDVDFLQNCMTLANIGISINSHLKTMMPRGGGDALTGNEICLEQVKNADSLYMWVVVNPWQKESYAQAERMLKHTKCLGIKIHPEEHLYSIREFGGEIYEFAAKNSAMIITHSGEGNSMPEDFCVLANRYPEVVTIISHLGCGCDGSFEHQIRAIQRNMRDNLYTDTSSAKSLFPNLIENAVKEIGSEKILFGSDNPCYFSPSQRARVDCAHIGRKEKFNILRRNAERLFSQLSGFYLHERRSIVNESTIPLG